MQDRSRSAITRLDRARVIVQVVLEAQAEFGRWEVLENHHGPSIRSRHVDIGAGWSASLNAGYLCAARRGEEHAFEGGEIGDADPDFAGEVLISVWIQEAGKVLSLYRDVLGGEKLIGMRPGPWEGLFGLPAQEWSPSVAKKMRDFARKAA